MKLLRTTKKVLFVTLVLLESASFFSCKNQDKPGDPNGLQAKKCEKCESLLDSGGRCSKCDIRQPQKQQCSVNGCTNMHLLSELTAGKCPSCAGTQRQPQKKKKNYYPN